MGLLQVNPNAEVSSFKAVKPGVYRMRVKSVEQRTENAKGDRVNDLKVMFEHVAGKADLYDFAGQPLGDNMPQVVSTYPSLEMDKQGMLRSIVEATGITWQEFIANPDTEVLVGKELDAQIKIEEYNGETNNKFGRAVKQ